MLLLSALAMLGVILGGAIGASGAAAERLLAPIRAAGLGSGFVAVFVQLVPEAAHDLGFVALVPFGLALLLSYGFERLLGGHRRGGGRRPGAAGAERGNSRDAEPPDAHGADPAKVSLDLGVIALAAHQLVEGVALGALAQAKSADGHHALQLGVVLGLAAHTVPIVAVLALATQKAFGLRGSLLRIGALALVSALGVIGSSLPFVQGAVEVAGPFVHAAVGGLLLHALLHAAVPRGAPARSSTLAYGLGLVAGAGLVVASVAVEGAHHQEHFQSPTIWLVVGGAIVIALLTHRAWPHAHAHV